MNTGFASPTSSGNGKHILIIDRALPDPTLDSGSVRLVEIIRLMQQLGWSVTFMADTTPAARLGPVKIGDTEIQVDRIGNLPTWLRMHGNSTNVVWLSRFQTVLKHAPLIRSLAPKVHIIFDTVDLHFLREHRRLVTEGESQANTFAARIRDMEIHACALADTSIAISDLEAKSLASLVPKANIVVLSNIHDALAANDVPGYGQRSGILFVGGMQHAPNLDALRWLAIELFPAIRNKLPDAELHVIGAIADADRSKFNIEGIILHGHVPDLEPWLSTCRVSIAPLRIGAGVKGKINSAMSHGLPVVATSIAAEGMHLEDQVDVLLADTSDGFAESVARLYNDCGLWTRLSTGGLLNIEQHYSPAVAKDALRQILSNNPRLAV